MIRLHDKDTRTVIGSITDEQLQFIIDQLEEEHDKDRDYYIDGPTLEMLEGHGADAELLKVLQDGLGARPEMVVEWREA